MALARTYPFATAFFRTPLRGAMPPRAPSPGSPRVRPGIRRHAPNQAMASSQLENLAQAALLRVDPSGALTWEIAVDDPVLGAITCLISWVDRRVSAAFVSETRETARLLEAEAGRLRALLADKGLPVSDITVLSGAASDDR